MSEVDKLLDELERQSELIAALRVEIATKDKRIKESRRKRERRMINVGDAVVWFSGERRGRRVSMRKGIGTVKKIEGDAAVIVTDLGSRVRKPLSVLRLKTNDTTYSIFEEVAKIL